MRKQASLIDLRFGTCREKARMEATGQPAKHDAGDLSFLYDFICECPDPHITEALRKLVAEWLAKPNLVRDLPAAMKEQLGLTDEESVHMCWLLAVNPNTPPSLLQDLCAGAPSALLERIAENKSTYGSTLATLSYQAVAEIRIAAASNANTPLASIMVLVNDDNPDVRYSMAENPTLPTEALQALTRDDNPYVRLRAEKTLDRLALEARIEAAQTKARDVP
jgi:hypothetical protein